MEKAKHTPGPWKLDENYISPARNERGRDCLIETSKIDLELNQGPGVLPFEEALANARLIASAPDMLNALEEFLVFAETWNGMMDELDGGEELTELRQKIEAVVSKATKGDA